MIQEIYQSNIILYALGVLCGLGLVLRLIVAIQYHLLLRESNHLGDTNNKMLRHLKMKFETCYRLNIGVNNVDTFVDKSVLRYRFCGAFLSTWENICGQLLLINLLTVPILGLFGFYNNCGQNEILCITFVGLSTAALMIFVDKSMNLSTRKPLLHLNLMDYLENFCKVRLEQETLHPELAMKLRQEFFQTAEGQSLTAQTSKTEPKEESDELNSRREARRKKEEEKRIQAKQREEEAIKALEARKEEERKRQEERKQAAAKRREDERLRLEAERKALEEKREELRRRTLEKQQALERKRQEAEQIRTVEVASEHANPTLDRADVDMLMEGLEEIAAEKERRRSEATLAEAVETVSGEENAQQTKVRNAGSKVKSKSVSLQEEKLIEDVLKEFFA